jgi:hypothetical protein
LRFFKLPLEALVVVHDEIDLAAGKLKVKTGGGDAGQNGLRSITATFGARTIAGCGWASAIPARRTGSAAMCCRISARTISPG